jgi:hypothetical protein
MRLPWTKERVHDERDWPVVKSKIAKPTVYSVARFAADRYVWQSCEVCGKPATLGSVLHFIRFCSRRECVMVVADYIRHNPRAWPRGV